ncbi:hypothetical protein PCS_02030 [Desulfocurvibacter africanus PCS]|uniref:EF-hand domain-containing protein n=1 Tax=Desulfocurvibacter africanus PCS TaxID=1262666 RepID=M5PS30_DESAF|nr:hypothetical protein [Desulfocurvibacter africanus]EMG37192.1 hypothetical protein PCS_02030 [Desulfocurvibacter africanus PCS]
MKRILIVLTCMAGLSIAGVAQAGIFGGGGEQQDQNLFQKVDENQDGQISQQEFSDYDFEEQDKTQLFNMLDEQGQGQIDQQQWQMKKQGGTSGSMQDMGTQEETGATTGDTQEYGTSDAPAMTGDTPGSPQGSTPEYGTTEGENGGMTSGGSTSGTDSGQ